MGPLVAEQALAGKHYNKAMRAHKLTLQALWRILLPHVLNFAELNAPDIHQMLTSFLQRDMNDHMQKIEELIDFCQTDRFQETMTAFLAEKENNPNFQF